MPGWVAAVLNLLGMGGSPSDATAGATACGRVAASPRVSGVVASALRVTGTVACTPAVSGTVTAGGCCGC